MHKIILKLILMTGLLTMTNYTQADSFFGVDLDLVNVGVEIRVNDIPIYDDSEAGQLTVELPSPESIINGVNVLTVFASRPERDEEVVESYELGAYVSAKLFRQDNNGDKQVLATLNLQLNREGELEPVKESILSDQNPVFVDLGNKAASLAVFAEIKSPFPQWLWQTGSEIENNQETFDSLLKVYREVYDALAAKDQTLLEKLYAKRAEEIAAAYSLNGVAEGHEKISTGKDALNPKLELLEFFEKNQELQIFGNGKLARIIAPDAGVQPIVYLQRNPTLAHIHKFMFYKNEKNQWVMIR